jgi:hypothetical protein
MITKTEKYSLIYSNLLIKQNVMKVIIMDWLLIKYLGHCISEKIKL